MLAASFAAGPLAAELAPLQVERNPGLSQEALARYSERTLSVALEIDRDQVRLVAYTVKPRPFIRSQPSALPRPFDAESMQLELVLFGTDSDARYTERLELKGICLLHGPDSAPHILGDTILMHRESVLVELPEVAALDRVEAAYHESERGALQRRSLGLETLDRSRFTPAGGAARYEELAFAAPATWDPPLAAATTGSVIWPEQIGDPDIYQIYGNPADGERRINIVIVPDGYTANQKSLMQSHAASVVAHFRNKTPYKEHDPFINYILVYAYSKGSGSDQCDCDIIRDTAMGTHFPEQDPQCENNANRCLNYGAGGCDTDSTSNIVAAELRAPLHDSTLVMVNTTRYGGCGGLRATFAAGNSSGSEIAVHELGHSIAGLADEYGGPGCGAGAGEINTSSNAMQGAWSEWIAELGAPQPGAQYYDQCLYRPLANCDMRSLNQPFCPVCSQRWSLVTFGHLRVSPSAPIEALTPAADASATTGVPADFAVSTRLSSGANVTNSVTWRIDGPGYSGPTVVATGVTGYTHTFSEPGLYELTSEVVADTNFVKPARYGANRDVATWSVEVTPLAPPAEVSPPGSAEPLRFASRTTLIWQDASATGSFSYNLYRGELALLGPGLYGSCLEQDIDSTTTSDSAEPTVSAGWFYLVTGENPAGEGPLGQDSQGNPRVSQAPCN